MSAICMSYGTYVGKVLSRVLIERVFLRAGGTTSIILTVPTQGKWQGLWETRGNTKAPRGNAIP